jgi:hypothetical protein
MKCVKEEQKLSSEEKKAPSMKDAPEINVRKINEKILEKPQFAKLKK